METIKLMKEENLTKKIYNLILFNYGIKRVFHSVFFSSFVQESSLYEKLLFKQQSKVIEKYKEKPFCVRIENTNVCNGHCIMCPRDSMRRKQGFMPEEIFRKAVDEAAEIGVEYINLHNFGEPLLDKDIGEKIIYAKKRGIKTVSTNSNGSVLNEDMAERLIKSGLDKLFISIDAFGKESYEKVRIGLNYDALVKNINNFIKIRKESGQSKPELAVNFVVVKENKKEVQNFIRNWKNIADHVSISFSHDWAGDKKDLDIEENNYLSLCRLLWTELTVAWNGDYILCCQDYDGKVILGNVLKNSIKEVWQGEKINFFREKQLKEGRKNLPLCKSCKLNTFWWF